MSKDNSWQQFFNKNTENTNKASKKKNKVKGANNKAIKASAKQMNRRSQ